MDQPSSKRSARSVVPYFSALAVIVAAIPSAAQNSAVLNDIRPARSVVISVPDRRLAILEGDTVIATFPVAVGASETPSPTGEFRIVSRVVNPTYYHPGVVIPSGKDNPVGTRWVGLSLKGYGIHGTNVPQSVGRAASHGCIRLRNRDMERLFSMLQVGDRVEIHGERDEQVARVFGGITTDQTVAEAGSDAPASGQAQVGLGQ